MHLYPSRTGSSPATQEQLRALKAGPSGLRALPLGQMWARVICHTADRLMFTP